jgi:hypothetical protein
VARKFGHYNARRTRSRKHSKSEQGYRGDAHLAENVSTLAVLGEWAPSQLHDLGTCLNSPALLVTGRSRRRYPRRAFIGQREKTVMTSRSAEDHRQLARDCQKIAAFSTRNNRTALLEMVRECDRLADKQEHATDSL